VGVRRGKETASLRSIHRLVVFSERQRTSHVSQERSRIGYLGPEESCDPDHKYKVSHLGNLRSLSLRQTRTIHITIQLEREGLRLRHATSCKTFFRSRFRIQGPYGEIHLPLWTGKSSLSTVMARLLTGDVVSFKRRHRRHGSLFQKWNLLYRQLVDPEPFYEGLNKETAVIFDEIHRLEDPSRLLKIAADAYPHLKILAKGSSTLAATRKFRDSLTGRKQTTYPPPVLWSECIDDFGVKSLDHRLLHGGLPEPLLSAAKDPAFFSEWMDSFRARDIQELFGIRNRSGFMKLLHLLLRQNGLPTSIWRASGGLHFYATDVQ
jgi:hypothetical protein